MIMRFSDPFEACGALGMRVESDPTPERHRLLVKSWLRRSP